MNKQHQRQVLDLLYYDGKWCAGRWRNARHMPWLSDYPGATLSEKAWNVLHLRPTCKCGKPTDWINHEVGYRGTCSRSCGQLAISGKKSEWMSTKWAHPQWKSKTAAAMKQAHHANRAQAKLDKLALKGITPLDPISPGMQNTYRWRHRCGEVFERPFTRVTGIWCPVCHVSRGQGEVYETIRSMYSGPIVVNDRKAIKPREIDIYMPELQVGIEYHGEYWHPGDGTREADKIKYAAEQGIKIIEIWETLWKQKRQHQLALLREVLKPR